jgi:hypothetical protein
MKKPVRDAILLAAGVALPTLAAMPIVQVATLIAVVSGLPTIVALRVAHVSLQEIRQLRRLVLENRPDASADAIDANIDVLTWLFRGTPLASAHASATRAIAKISQRLAYTEPMAQEKEQEVEEPAELPEEVHKLVSELGPEEEVGFLQ